eukprot:3046947-Pleurochrysis_carterae.AAC.1
MQLRDVHLVVMRLQASSHKGKKGEVSSRRRCGRSRIIVARDIWACDLTKPMSVKVWPSTQEASKSIALLRRLRRKIGPPFPPAVGCAPRRPGSGSIPSAPPDVPSKESAQHVPQILSPRRLASYTKYSTAHRNIQRHIA